MRLGIVGRDLASLAQVVTNEHLRLRRLPVGQHLELRGEAAPVQHLDRVVAHASFPLRRAVERVLRLARVGGKWDPTEQEAGQVGQTAVVDRVQRQTLKEFQECAGWGWLVQQATDRAVAVDVGEVPVRGAGQLRVVSVRHRCCLTGSLVLCRHTLPAAPIATRPITMKKPH
ncbi:hypothetical protein AB0H63_10680 [Micromonospora echinospora]|uniref:hypothetical protein n=1 Tax=Micromonospora echinospora TaxID=1877 RepID=UPI003409DBFF